MYCRWPVLLWTARTRPQLREDERCEASTAADGGAADAEGGAGAEQALQRGARAPGPIPAAHDAAVRARADAAASSLARSLLRERNRCVRSEKGEAHVPILSRQGASINAASRDPAAALVYIQTNPHFNFHRLVADSSLQPW